LTDRSIAQEEKRRLILDAAVRVFARDGFHTSRVGDIAEEAGVAHGLLYHYFSSKDEVLQTVFRENWAELLERFEAVEASDEPADEKLRGIVKILLRTWRNDPALVTVMVREVGRSPQLATQVDDIGRAFAVIERVIERGQSEGVFRPEVDPRLASWVVYGGLEEILTGWVMGRLPDGDEEVARAERTIFDVVCGGLARAAVTA
jgi:TetR/AcrR family transcriptional regulator, fatty acid metabolism regulator protein